MSNIASVEEQTIIAIILQTFIDQWIIAMENLVSWKAKPWSIWAFVIGDWSLLFFFFVFFRSVGMLVFER